MVEGQGKTVVQWTLTTLTHLHNQGYADDKGLLFRQHLQAKPNILALIEKKTEFRISNKKTNEMRIKKKKKKTAV